MTVEAIENWQLTLPKVARSKGMVRIKDLATRIVQKRVEFLCGAGMSRASGLQLAQEFSTAIVSKLVDADYTMAQKFADMFPLEAVAAAYLAQNDPTHLKEAIKESVSTDGRDFHDGHKALEGIANEDLIDRIYTTNFDDLLEKTFGDRSITIIDENADELSQPSNGKFPIIHLHGFVGSKCLLTEEETYNLDTPLGTIMRADMVSNWFVWIGHSLTDVDLKALYFSMQKQLKKEGLAKRPFVVHPLKDDDLNRAGMEWELADEIWNARGMSFIPGRAEIFLPALHQQVRQIKGERTVETILRKRGLDPKIQSEVDKVWREAEQMSRKSGIGDPIQALQVIAERESE